MASNPENENCKFPELLLAIYQTTWHNIPEEYSLSIAPLVGQGKINENHQFGQAISQPNINDLPNIQKWWPV
jgi:hypothetical protein